MPAGWQNKFKHNDHRGEVFCIRVPVSARHGISILGEEPEAEKEAGVVEVEKQVTRKGKVRYRYFRSTTVRVPHTNATATRD